MKKIFIAVFCLLLLSGCTLSSETVPNSETKKETTQAVDYVKAIWFPYYELQKLTQGKNEKNCKKAVETAFSEIKEDGFNTVTVQVRPCADAFYPSDYYPCSYYCFGKQGSDMPYDPFRIMCDMAASLNLKIEAWINPYRVSFNSDIESLCAEHPAAEWLKNSKKKYNVYLSDKGIYFNPASNDVTKLIVAGVTELVENYSISAVHFDDYFYPTTEKDIDAREYKKYQKKGGKLSLSDWRRENINKMVKSVYSAVKGVNPDVRFGISPASDIRNDRNTLYADVEKWMTEDGYIDYICPQVYFGFRNIYQPFMFTVKKWMYLAKCDLYIGLPLYKAGKADKYAAKEDKSIINEFKNNDNIVARQITYLSKLEDIKGYYVFSYADLHSERAKNETEHMLKAMQDSNPS